ncbi:hypothetical protein EAE96_005758 [Botrytis aclada]|nr:hypothetical protein EAE96_005758 [Botrytis aclada]
MVSASKLLGAALAFAFSAVVSGRNTIHFKALDNVPRIISFTSHPECADIEEIHHRGGEDFMIEMPPYWAGTVMARLYGGVHPINRAIAEFKWQGFEGKTHYDASAVDNHTDNTGVHWVYPAGLGHIPEARSGCTVFPCDNAYLLWDDVQTRVTYQTDMVVEIGPIV